MKNWTLNSSRVMYSLLLYTVLLIGIACTPNDSSALTAARPDQQNEEQEQDGLEIRVFEFANLSNLGSPETVLAVSQNNLSLLNNDDLAKADIVITEEDILTYDWSTQKLVLDNTFRERYGIAGSILSDFSIFIVSFKGKPLFSGMVLPIFSQMRREIPILYVVPPLLESPGEDGLVVYLKPQTLVIGQEDEESEFPIVDRELAEQIREHLQMNGKLISEDEG
jgi:hypothetical protein